MARRVAGPGGLLAVRLGLSDGASQVAPLWRPRTGPSMALRIRESTRWPPQPPRIWQQQRAKRQGLTLQRRRPQQLPRYRQRRHRRQQLGRQITRCKRPRPLQVVDSLHGQVAGAS